ncbi:MAG: hypothetical protein NTV63_04225 [Candidatus Woesearchaeota archaeon]|nr:hypothetical protein [Candidatus Woesearchaeota archaeon]
MTEKNLDCMVMYHFTNRTGWKGVNEGDPDYLYEDPRTGKYIEGKNIRGLWPSRRLIAQGQDSALVPSEATKPAVFGLPEEKPQSWIQYQDSTNIFDYLMSCCAGRFDEEGKRDLVLLQIDLKPEDNPFVVDYLHIRHLAKDFTAESDAKRKQTILAEGNKRYWDSRVPLADYKGNFTLPEIVIWAPIPQDRVHFVWKKDLHQFLNEAHCRS